MSEIEHTVSFTRKLEIGNCTAIFLDGFGHTPALLGRDDLVVAALAQQHRRPDAARRIVGTACAVNVGDVARSSTKQILDIEMLKLVRNVGKCRKVTYAIGTEPRTEHGWIIAECTEHGEAARRTSTDTNLACIDTRMCRRRSVA